MRFLIL